MRHSIVDSPMVASHVDVPYHVENTSAAGSFVVVSCQEVSLVSGAYLAMVIFEESPFESAAFD